MNVQNIATNDYKTKKLYKGFVIAKNKRPIEPIKGVDNFKSLDEIRALNVREYSGVLKDDVVLIDFDDSKSARIAARIIKEKKLKCRVIETNRGLHVLFRSSKYFKSCLTNTKLAIGINADIKIGGRNTLEFLKENGVERNIVYDDFNDNDTEPYDEAPYFFYPIKTDVNLLEMKDGDGRNSTLFKYIIVLMKYMDKIKVKECIKEINDKVFDTPLSQDELNIILRDESFDNVQQNEKGKFFGEKGDFLFDDFANFLVEDKHIIKINNQLHIYKDGVYVNGAEYIEREMINNISKLTQAKRKEVVSYVNLLIEENSNPSLFNNYIAFKNGLYNIMDKTLYPFDKNIIITNRVNWNYNPNAYSKIIDDALNKLSNNDKEIRTILEEMIGYSFYRQNEMGKAFILVGPQSNGKSTFQGMLQLLLGINNISSIDLKDLSERFKTAELYGKLANIGDDIGDAYIDDNNIFKTIVTGGRVIAEKKGKDPFEFEPYVKCIFSANNIPKTRDKTGAIKRRLIIIPFDRVFSPKDADYDPYFKYKITNGTNEYTVDDNMSYLINIGLKGLERVIVNKTFSTSVKVNDKINEYDKGNNPIKIFFDDIDANKSTLHNNNTQDVYNKYTRFCDENKLSPMSKIEFSKFICSEFGLVTKVTKFNGKTIRTFVIKE